MLLDLGGATGLQTVIDRPGVTPGVSDELGDLQIVQTRAAHCPVPVMTSRSSWPLW